jgi:hypothetical protein
MIIFVFFNFLAFWPFPWQRQPFWKKSTLKSTTSHGIWYSYKVSYYYGSQTYFVRHINFALFLIITSPWLLSGDVLLFYVSFSLLLHHPDCCRVMYCYSTHMAYDIPTRFHKVWSRHLREIERTKMCGRIIIIRIIIIVKKKRRIAIHHPTTVGVM